mgnify:CR=1 FL=1
MNALQIALLIIGIIVFAGSFFITEKLSSSDVEMIKKLSQKEVRSLVDNELDDAKNRMSMAFDEKVNESMERIESGTDKDFTDKIVSLGEYFDEVKAQADPILSAMQKTNSENNFLYNMLNDKQENITRMLTEIQAQESALRGMKEGIDTKIDELKAMEIAVQQKEDAIEAEKELHFEENVQSLKDAFIQKMDEDDKENKTEHPTTEKGEMKKKIISMNQEGYSEVEIAKKLGVGLGEIKLILGLFE